MLEYSAIMFASSSFEQAHSVFLGSVEGLVKSRFVAIEAYEASGKTAAR